MRQAGEIKLGTSPRTIFFMNFQSFVKKFSVLCVGIFLLIPTQEVDAEGIWREVKGKDRTHVVKSGENLYTIAKNYGLAIEHLAFANGRDPNNINVAPGTSLLIPGRRVLPSNPPDNGLVVNLPERGVYLFRNGSFEKFYPVAIGQPGKFETPTGSYTIESRTKDPAWFPPEWSGLKDEVVPAGPDNPLGDRWIGITAPGIGFHSTTAPMSIGQAVSHGCMRMYPNSVRELFEKVQVGWPVRIDYEVSKIGCDYDEDRYYLVTYPDIYKKNSPTKSVNKTLQDVGLSVAPEDLKYFAKTDGVCKELYVSGVSVSVGAQRLREWPIEPSMVDGSVWGSPKIAAAVGLNVEWDNDKQVVKVSRNKEILYFPVNDNYVLDFNDVPVGCKAWVAGSARKVGSATIIPLRPVLQAFKVSSQWIEEERELRLSVLPKVKAKPKTAQAVHKNGAPTTTKPAPEAASTQPKAAVEPKATEVKATEPKVAPTQPKAAVEPKATEVKATEPKIAPTQPKAAVEPKATEVKATEPKAASTQPKAAVEPKATEVKATEPKIAPTQPKAAVEPKATEVKATEPKVAPIQPKAAVEPKGGKYSSPSVPAPPAVKSSEQPALIVPKAAPLPEEKDTDLEDTQEKVKYRTWHKAQQQNFMPEPQNDIGID